MIAAPPQRIRMADGDAFLPTDVGKTEQLIYLTKIAQNSSFSPFTEEQQKVFDTSIKADKLSSRCLWLDCTFNGITVIGNLVLLTPCCFPAGLAAQVITGIANQIALTWSWFATGKFPDTASQKANNMQNKSRESEKTYIELGIHLVELVETDPKLAAEVAQSLQTNVLREVMKRRLDAVIVETHIIPLEGACKFLLHKEIPNSPPDLHNAVNIIFLKWQNRALSETVLALNRKIDQLEATIYGPVQIYE